MTDEHLKLLNLAKQGDTGAIAFLLNRSLQPKGITAKADLKNKCLLVMLEAAKVPEQNTLVAFLQKGLGNLRSPAIQEVKVYGKQTSELFPAWSQNFMLVSPSYTASGKSVDSSSHNKCQSANTKISENTKPSQYVSGLSLDNSNKVPTKYPNYKKSRIESSIEQLMNFESSILLSGFKALPWGSGLAVIFLIFTLSNPILLGSTVGIILGIFPFSLVVTIIISAFSKEIREKRFYTTFFSIVSILSIFVGLASGSISFFIAAIGFAGIAINLHKSLLKKAKTEEIENKQEEIENTSILKEFSDCFPTLDTNRFSNKFNLSEIKRPNDPVIRSDYTFYVNNIGYSEGAIPSVDVTGKAALVEFTVFNHTNSNQSFSIPILYLIDENLNEYSKSSFSSAVSRGREGLAESDNLRPNQEGAFYVLFDINLDSEGIMLEYRPLLGRKNLISLAM